MLLTLRWREVIQRQNKEKSVWYLLIHGLLVLICTDVGNYSFTFVSGQLHDTCAYDS